MAREIYVPVFDSFFESSIMREPLIVRFVMLALIRLAWRPRANGVIDVDPLIFAGSLNLPPADVEEAIKRLMEPDPLSASPDEDGRRIIPVHPDRPMRGWRLVNWQRYRIMVNRINDAARQRETYHAQKDTAPEGESATSGESPESPKTSSDHRNSPAFTDFPVTRRDETIRNETKKPPTRGDQERVHADPDFAAFWGLYPRKLVKLRAERAWRRLNGEDRARAVRGAVVWARAWEAVPADFRGTCPHPASWLNARRWEDPAADVEATAARALRESRGGRPPHLTAPLAGKAAPQPAPERPKRDPNGSHAPARAREAARKREEWALWEAAYGQGIVEPKPEPFHPAKFYGPNSRADERERLQWWEGGMDDAFDREPVPVAAGSES